MNGIKEDEFNNFVDKAIRYKTYKGNFKLGYVQTNLAREIKKRTGIETKGFKVLVYADDLRHAIKAHGNETKERKNNQRAITKEDLKLIPLIIDKFHFISSGKGIDDGKKYDSAKIHYFQTDEYIIICEIIISEPDSQLKFKTQFIKKMG